MRQQELKAAAPPLRIAGRYINKRADEFLDHRRDVWSILRRHSGVCARTDAEAQRGGTAEDGDHFLMFLLSPSSSSSSYYFFSSNSGATPAFNI